MPLNTAAVAADRPADDGVHAISADDDVGRDPVAVLEAQLRAIGVLLDADAAVTEHDVLAAQRVGEQLQQQARWIP